MKRDDVVLMESRWKRGRPLSANDNSMASDFTLQVISDLQLMGFLPLSGEAQKGEGPNVKKAGTSGKLDR